MKTYKQFAGILLCLFSLNAASALAQSGDQILDGIGETGLIARYTLKTDIKDWSRNNLHGSIKGSDFKFVEDSLFGSALSLTGNSEAYISVPGASVKG